MGMGSAEFAEDCGLVSSERQADKHTGSIAMTEWHGIEVGGLYKRTGRGSRGEPLALVTEVCDRGDEATVTVLVDGKQDWFYLFWGETHGYDDYGFCDGLQQVAYDNDDRPRYSPWPYKEVSV